MNDTFDDAGDASSANKIMSIATPFYDTSRIQGGALGIIVL